MDPLRIAELVVNELNNRFVDNFKIDEAVKRGQKKTVIVKDTTDNVSAVVYVDDICDMMRAGHTLGEILTMLDDLFRREPPGDANAIVEILSEGRDVPKELLSVRLLSEERSSGGLENAIYKKVADDLVLVLEICIKTEDGMERAMIPKELYEDRKDKMFEEAMDNIEVTYYPLGPGLYCVSNDTTMFGASSLFADGMIDKIRTDLGGDFYIIPSSLHEVLVVPKNGMKSADQLRAMIREANCNVVEERDVLSDNLYECVDGKVKIAQ